MPRNDDGERMKSRQMKCRIVKEFPTSVTNILRLFVVHDSPIGGFHDGNFYNDSAYIKRLVGVIFDDLTTASANISDW